MGPSDQEPPRPAWEFSLVRPDQRYVSKRLQECNWLQAMEGGKTGVLDKEAEW